jgi:DNA-binding protein Fis
LVEGEPQHDMNPPSEMSLEQVERRAIVQAMDLSDFNQRKAARMLKVHRATLARKLKKHKLG